MNINPIIGRGWNFPIQIGPAGTIGLTSEENEISQAIRIILATSPGERVMRPLFGSRLHELVFAPINGETMALAERYAEDALKMWEPRINISEIQVTPEHDDGRLLIHVFYELKQTRDRRSLIYPFYLIPSE